MAEFIRVWREVNGEWTWVTEEFSGGGSQPSDALYLECNTPPIDGGSAVWDTIYDRRGYPHTLAEIPAEYGLTLDGGAITTAERGKWHFELMCNPAADATAKGKVTLTVQGDYTGGPTIDMPSLSPDLVTVEACMTCWVDVDAGNAITVTGNATDETAVDYKMIGYAVLKIVRWA